MCNLFGLYWKFAAINLFWKVRKRLLTFLCFYAVFFITTIWKNFIHCSTSSPFLLLDGRSLLFWNNKFALFVFQADQICKLYQGLPETMDPTDVALISAKWGWVFIILLVNSSQFYYFIRSHSRNSEWEMQEKGYFVSLRISSAWFFHSLSAELWWFIKKHKKRIGIKFVHPCKLIQFNSILQRSI